MLRGYLCRFLALASLLAAPSFAADPTFGRDVWPILAKNCISCHQPGEIAPMAFTSYKQARPWARSIREAVLSKAMPPWSAAPATNHPFRDVRRLSQAEIDTLVAWVDTGALEGGTPVHFTPAPREEGWKLGKPDLVLQIPGYAVPKEGVLPYSFLIFPGLFPRDTWIRAAEWRIENRRVIHHINAFVRAPGSSFLAGFPSGQVFVPTVVERGSRRAGERLFDRRELVQGYEPGYIARPWLEDGAKLVKAGSDVVFEMHYTPNGREVTDHSELALYFAPKPPAYRVLAVDTLRDLDLAIPPDVRDYVSHASMTLAQSARLLSIQPHMHLRGKSMTVRAIYPSGGEETLLNVPKYDFHWQTTYVFEDPVKLPQGTRLDSVATYDNSESNKFNPDPSSTVHWGDQTTDEMHIAFLELVIDAKADPDSLFQSAPKMIGPRISSLK